MFRTNKVEFFKIFSEYLNETITLKSENFNKAYNIKENHYVNYKYRFLNNYIKSSSSLNNASRLKFYTSKKIALKFKHLLCYFTSEKLNPSTKNKLKKEIEQWAVGRFEESNKISSQLTNLNLEELGYKI